MSRKGPTNLILVGGFAGAGKTTLAKSLARLTRFAFLDKDTLTAPLVEALLIALQSPNAPHDRESPIYSHQVRALEYECLMSSALESVALEISTIVVAPLSRELCNAAWRANLSNALGPSVKVHCLWVFASEEIVRKRLIERGAARDRGKLDNWNDYCAQCHSLVPVEPYTPVDCSDDRDSEARAYELIERLGLT